MGVYSTVEMSRQHAIDELVGWLTREQSKHPAPSNEEISRLMDVLYERDLLNVRIVS